MLRTRFTSLERRALTTVEALLVTLVTMMLAIGIYLVMEQFSELFHFTLGNAVGMPF